MLRPTAQMQIIGSHRSLCCGRAPFTTPTATLPSAQGFIRSPDRPFLTATPACPARPYRSQSLPCSAGSTSSRPTSSGCRYPSAAATPPATTSSCAKGSPSASQAFPKCSRDHEQHKRTQSKVDDNGHNPWPSLLNFQVHRFGLHAEQLPVISGQYDTQSGYLGGIFFTTLGRGSWPCATADKS